MNTNTTTVPTNSVPEIKPKKQCKKNSPRFCSVEGCNKPHSAKGFCILHYYRIIKLQWVEPNTPPQKKQNEVIFDGDICKIIITDINDNYQATTIIDKENYDKIKNHYWFIRRNYIVGYKKREQIVQLTHTIMPPPKGMVVDHINHDTLDNRVQNLRICTQQENTWNTRTFKKKGYKGVVYIKNRPACWKARITFNNKQIILGIFKDPEAAALAYNEAAIKYFGEFACLNEIKKEASND